MKSLPPKEYAQLPQLAAPAGYICVIRDVDNGDYRIEGTTHPAAFLQSVLAEADGNFGIELLSILQTDNLQASQSELYDQHQALLSSEWLQLDPYQLQELQRSILQINAYNSCYLTSQHLATTETATRLGDILRAPRPAPAKVERPISSKRQPRTSPKTLASNHYGMRALAQYREVDSATRGEATTTETSWKMKLEDKLNDLWHNHPGWCIVALLLTLLICYLTLDYSCEACVN